MKSELRFVMALMAWMPLAASGWSQTPEAAKVRKPQAPANNGEKK